MQRRHLLAVLGASALSGCVGSDVFGTAAEERRTSRPTTKTTPRRTTEPGTRTTNSGTSTSGEPATLAVGESFETASGETVTVHAIRIRKSIVSGGVHYDPVTLSGRQFVVPEVSVATADGRTTSESEHLRGRELSSRFRVGLDGKRYPKTDRVFHVVPRSEESEGVRLGFPAPAPANVERGAIVWIQRPVVRWELTDDHRHALAHPPSFEVRAFRIPETVERESAFDATLTVGNVGPGDGVFLAELGATTISDTPEIRVEVPARARRSRRSGGSSPTTTTARTN
jgi:hypothetical protein